MTNQISKIMLIAMLFSTTLSFGQEARIALKGNAYAVGTQGKAGLEVGGKLVLAKDYKSFQTDGDGILFAVEANDGKYGVVDRKGTWIYKPTYYKAQITGDMIRLQTTANSEPKFYKVTSPTTEVTVTKVDPNAFAPEIRAVHESMEAKAKEIAAQDPFTAFSFKTNSRGWQELYVDGKKLFEARTWSLISTYDFYKKTTCWYFIVTDQVQGRKAYGLYILSIEAVDGKKVIDTLLSIPIEYSYIAPKAEAVVTCTTFSGAQKFLDWEGNPITGKK